MYLQNLARGNQEKQNCVKNLSGQAIDKGNVSRFPTPGPNTNFRHPVPVLGLSFMGPGSVSMVSDRRSLPEKQWPSNPALIFRSVTALLNQNKLTAVVKSSELWVSPVLLYILTALLYQIIAREIEA